MFRKLIETSKQHIQNIPGWRTDQKIIVMESDDWGAIRMPSKQVYNALLKCDISVDKYYYNKYDTLESEADLSALFELLISFKDKNDKYPVMTFNTIMGNPDFEKIEKSDFQQYYHQHFYNTYKEYYGINMTDIWEEGINLKVIKPQFHGREHLNVDLWLNALQKNVRETIIAFQYRFFGMNKTNTLSERQKNYLAAFWVENEIESQNKGQILEEGLKLFEDTFGFKSSTFIPCNYVFPKSLESVLKELNVNYLQGQRGHLSPDPVKKTEKVIRNYTGQMNRLGQYYMVRNCLFEPSSDWNRDWVDTCMRDIEISFKWKKPAIISTHRINYVGGMSLRNRDRGLAMLNQLLSRVLERWPDVEFMTSDQVGQLIAEDSGR